MSEPSGNEQGLYHPKSAVRCSQDQREALGLKWYSLQALTLHPPPSAVGEFAVLGELPARCDESFSDKILCVAGYIGSTDTWLPVETEWVKALVDEDLKEFHAEHCEHGNGEFAGRDAAALQQRFIRILMHSDLRSYVSVLDWAAWKEVQPIIKGLRPPGYWRPFWYLFQYHVETMTYELDHFPAYQRVAFIFDRHAKSGKSCDVYKGLRDSGMEFAPRLGAFAVRDSRDYPALQAADLLAYEARKQFEAEGFNKHVFESKRRWQWAALTAFEPHVHVTYITAELIKGDIIKALERDAQARAERESKEKEERAARRAAHEARQQNASPSRARKSPSAPPTPAQDPPEESL
jgi:hypothetical protein